MSAKRFTGTSSLQPSVSVSVRDAKLELSTNMVSIHKNGIEFRSPKPFNEWSEMTVGLLSPKDGQRISCHGVIVGCAGNKHTGYHISMVFTELNAEAQKQLGTMARSEFGAG
ncbi:MAG TPA: PilZ domain-containing protein [Candidatus Acidoferrales bacterium]|nr:PilZ domain-containing protein [Candidatus Acidoferrales bacterium]